MNVSLSPLFLPLETLRLFARNWGPLLAWYCAGYLIHDLLLRGAAELGHISREAGLVVLSIGVLVNLVVVIAMFHVVRRDLPTLTRLVHIQAGGYPASWSGEEQRVIETVGRGVLPFLILYGAWGLYLDDVRRYANLGLREGDLGLLTEIGFGVALSIVAVSLLLRILVERPFRRTANPFLGIVVAFFETVWMFFAVFSVLQVFRSAESWVTSRVAWAEAVSVCTAAIRRIHLVLDELGLGAVSNLWMALYGYLPDLKDGLALPLLWLTIAAVVYGRDMQRSRDVIAGNRRLERVGGAVEQIPGRTRSRAELLAQGPRDKYVPLLNALRLVLNAGPSTYLVFCALYVGLSHATNWAWIGLTRLIGPHDQAFWEIVLIPISFGTEALYNLLRITLLAATFELVLRRVNARNAGPDVALSHAAQPAARPAPTPPAG